MLRTLDGLQCDCVESSVRSNNYLVYMYNTMLMRGIIHTPT